MRCILRIIQLVPKGKIAELALGYGGSISALKSMGAIEMRLLEEELKPLVDMWRQSNPHIVSYWWDVDRAVKKAIKERTTTTVGAISFSCHAGMLFIHLPSGRSLSYVKPRIGENQFGGESVTYMGIGSTKKWERLESYGPKFVENIVQAISRDILCYAMRTPIVLSVGTSMMSSFLNAARMLITRLSVNRWSDRHLSYLASYSGLMDTKQCFIKKIKKTAVPMCLVSPHFL